MYLIVSGTGRVGSAVARALLADGAKVRVGARHPGRLNELYDLGAEVTHVDLTDPGTLAPALKGVQAVLATAHAMTGKGANSSRKVDLEGNRAFIEAARQNGVGRFVFISALGVRAGHPVDFFRHKFATEELLRTSGMAYTILRPAAFMEIWGDLIGKSAMMEGKATLFGPGTNPISFISERDVVAFCIMALTGSELHNRMIELGAENLTHSQVAGLYGCVAGKQVKIRHIPLPLLRTMAVLLSPFDEGSARLMRTAVNMATTEQQFDPTELLQDFPRRLITFEEVAREAAAVLLKAQPVTR